MASQTGTDITRIFQPFKTISAIFKLKEWFCLTLPIVMMISACSGPSPRQEAKTGPNQDHPSPQIALLTHPTHTIFEIELAKTPQQRMRGLMYRKKLAPQKGMLFIYPIDDDHGFWMKNTAIPLDMIFINSELSVVGIIANAEPFSLATCKVGRPSRYILEINAGLAARFNINVGTKVRLIDVPSAP